MSRIDWPHIVAASLAADPDHEDHDDMIDWRDPDFDLNTVDEAAIGKALAKLAKSRRRKNRK